MHVFSPNEANSNNTSGFCLNDLIDKPVWVAWQKDIRNGKETKVPYTAPGKKAFPNNPQNWKTLEEIAPVAAKMSGAGIMLGIDCGGGCLLGGLDLDSCIEDGILAGWANEVVKRYRSYTEISPSLTGAKIFFRYRKSDQDNIRALMGTQHSRMYKRPGGDDAGHAPGIEFHISNRYFTVTDDGLPETTNIRIVDIDDLKWVIEKVGPEIAGESEAGLGDAAEPPPTFTNGYAKGGTSRSLDNSASGIAYRKTTELRECGFVTSYAELRDALLKDPDTATWAATKGLANQEREIHRLFERASFNQFIASQMVDMRRTFEQEKQEGDSTEETQDNLGTAQDGEVHDDSNQSPSVVPLDIFGSLTPEPVLEPDMLPPTIRDLAFDAADRVGITPATVAMAAIAVCAAALHGEIVIQPTEDWDWVEPPILWAMAVGDPGVTHTTALNTACRPLEAIDREWREADAEAITKYERAHAIWKEHIRLWDKAAAAGKAEGSEPVEPQEPQRRQLITTDYTMESVEEILAVNPRGILLKIDELAGFIGNFDAYRTGKSGKDRPLALKLWDGGRLAVDRVGKHTLVPNWAAGSVGKMQDNKLAALAHSLTDDGFMQRFLPYRVGITGMGSHRPADREAIDQYDMLVRFLVNLEPSGRPITLSEGAQEYQREIERITFALKTSPMVSPPMRAHASKLNGLYARVLLVIHLIDHHNQNGYMGRETDLMVVGAATAKRTRDLMVRFLIPNSVSIYAQYFDDCDERGSDARWIADYILSRHSDRITERDLYRAKREFEDKKRLLRAIDSLIDASWLTRSSSGLAVNPTVHSAHAERAEQTRRKREGIKAKIAEQTETLNKAYG